MQPIPNNTPIQTTYGAGVVRKSYERRTTLSLYKTTVEFTYDVEIDGKVRRVFTSEITSVNVPTLHRKEITYAKGTEKTRVSNITESRRLVLEDVGRRAQIARDLYLSGADIYKACKEAGVDYRSYMRRFPQT